MIDISSYAVRPVLINPFIDFEDTLQFTAVKQFRRIHTIVTRNSSDYKASKLPVLKPKEFLAELNAEKLVNYQWFLNKVFKSLVISPLSPKEPIE